MHEPLVIADDRCRRSMRHGIISRGRRYRGPRGRRLRLPEVGYPNVRNGGEQLTSVLFPHDGTAPDVDAPPDCFHDLRLGDIVAAVCEGHPDDRVARLFYQPLREVSAVEHRHQVFGDLERSNVRQPITDFTDAMATMRGQLRQADWLQHRWQRHGWFVYAVPHSATPSPRYATVSRR